MKIASYYPQKKVVDEAMLLPTMLWAELLVPWLTLFFVDRDTVRRYMPVTILSALLQTVVFEMGYVFDWWTISAKILPWGTITNLSYAYGIFSVTTFWVFALTFRRYPVFFLTNLLIDACWSYGMDPIFVRMGLYRLDHMTHTGVLIIMTILAQLLYLYQRWQFGVVASSGHGRGERSRFPGGGFGRQKAR